MTSTLLSRKPRLCFSHVLLLFSLLGPTFAISQTKPAAAKSAAARPAAAKPAAKKPAAAKASTAKTSTAKKSPAAAGQKSTARPASAAPAKTSGQAVTTRPVTGNSASPENRSSSTTSSGAPTKTATAPATDYKAKSNTAAPQPSARKQKSYSYGFNQQDKLLNVGVGFSSYYYGTPFGVSFEAGVHKDISVGAQLDFNSGRYNDYYYSSYRWGYKAYYVGVRGSYHFNRLLKINSSKVDVYAGVGLGYQTFRWNDRSYGYGYNYSSGLFYNYFIGGKYYFTPKVAAFAELGYTGLSTTRVGIAFKF